jgi:hypothetical protein
VLISYTEIINQRELSEADVAHVNYVLKARASRFVASASKDDLFPEEGIGQPRWSEIDRIFYTKYPSSRSKSEMLLTYEDGTILYTNAFGERDVVPGWFVRQQEAKKKKPNTSAE